MEHLYHLRVASILVPCYMVLARSEYGRTVDMRGHTRYNRQSTVLRPQTT
jgi:hypothetical protein